MASFPPNIRRICNSRVILLKLGGQVGKTVGNEHGTDSWSTGFTPEFKKKGVLSLIY